MAAEFLRALGADEFFEYSQPPTVLTFSKTVGYGIQVLSLLNGPEGVRLSIQDLAEAGDVPKAYLAKVINRLARNGLIDAKRGPGGGLLLSRSAEEITLEAVVEAFDEKVGGCDCMLGMEGEKADCYCPCFLFFDDLKSKVEDRLRSCTIADVVRHRERYNDEHPSSAPERRVEGSPRGVVGRERGQETPSVTDPLQNLT